MLLKHSVNISGGITMPDEVDILDTYFFGVLICVVLYCSERERKN